MVDISLIGADELFLNTLLNLFLDGEDDGEPLDPDLDGLDSPALVGRISRVLMFPLVFLPVRPLPQIFRLPTSACTLRS